MIIQTGHGVSMYQEDLLTVFYTWKEVLVTRGQCWNIIPASGCKAENIIHTPTPQPTISKQLMYPRTTSRISNKDLTDGSRTIIINLK